jgi:signal-transduction protein with cAMP-binding, CBS, and nucleotidyltransferase domain
MKEILLYLSRQFWKLSDKSKNYILDHCDEKAFAKGEHLLEAGKVCRHVWFIKKGLIRAYQRSPSKPDKQFTGWFMTDNDTATSVRSFFMELPSDVEIVAEEETVVFEMTRKDLFAGVETHHDMAILTLYIVIHYYCDTRFVEMYLRMKEPQLIFQSIAKTFPELLTRTLQANLASFLGVSEPVYREIKSGKYKRQ